MMRETKGNYYKQKTESIGNGKKIFNVFKEFVSSKASSHYELPHSLLNANKLNDFFSGIGPSLVAKIKATCSDVEFFSSDKPNWFKTTNSQDVSNKNLSLKNKSTFGHDIISNALLKSCEPVISCHIAKNLNYCFSLKYCLVQVDHHYMQSKLLNKNNLI